MLCKKPIVYLICLILLYTDLSAQKVSAFKFTQEVIERTLGINEMYFEMKKTERVGGEYLSESFQTKLTYEPFRVYSKKIENGKSPELLYVHGKNENKALINPDGFPWFNISLDPAGSFMRRNQHHTLYETGYRYAVSILKYLFEKYGQEVENMSRYLSEEEINGVECLQVEFNNTYYKTISYTVKENENLVDIAKRLKISEFKILEYNKDIDNFDDVEVGQVITISNDYSPKMVMAIDKERHIPISVKVYDEFGLFEQYEYSNVKIEPGFKEEEFTESFSEYGF